jgi:MoxR-like ATPase
LGMAAGVSGDGERLMKGLSLDKTLLDRRLDGASFGARAAGATKRPYLVDDSLSAAAGLAVLLGQPLLLSGVPGVGKTGAAYHIASTLFGDDHEPIRYTVTTQTSGRDLLYKFDLLSRFHEKDLPLRRFLRFEALGRAIVASCGGNAVVLDSATDKPVDDMERIGKIVGPGPRDPGPLLLRELFPPTEKLHPYPEPMVVLVDEIDKAPRDTPNDLLESFEAMRLTVDELGLKIGASDSARDAVERKRSRPIIVATTNAENNLPDAFLRRCVFHEIKVPEGRMKDIVREHLKVVDKIQHAEADALAAVAVEIGDAVRDLVRSSSRVPGTAEYIALARAIHASSAGAAEMAKAVKHGASAEDRNLLAALVGVLVKTADDVGKALTLFRLSTA